MIFRNQETNLKRMNHIWINYFEFIFSTKYFFFQIFSHPWYKLFFQVTLHTPSTIPRPSQISFPASFDEVLSVAVNVDMYTTTEEVKSYKPQKRNCYFGNERKLKYFKLYGQSNCDLECWTNYTIQECGCVHFYMPREYKNCSIHI